MIRRLNPDIDYLDPADYERAGVSQIVIADGVVHWAGIVAAKGPLSQVTIPAPDMAGQLAFILDRIDACLAAAGTNRANIITLTMFTTDLAWLSASLGSAYRPWVGDHPPTLTVIGVAELAFPGALLEVQGSALTSG